MAGEEYMIGIDLGTTNSVACRIKSEASLADAQSTLKCVAYSSGKVLLKSAFAVKKDRSEKLFGDDAISKIDDPSYMIVTLSKLFIGKKMTDEELCMEAPNPSVRVVADPANPLKPVFESVHFDMRLTPEYVAAEILDHLIGFAIKDMSSGAVVTALAVTLPAHFNDRQRQATMAAGRAAMERRGFDARVVTLNEPTAALYAVLCRMTPAQRLSYVGKRILVVDVGGGTTDVSLVDIESKDGRMELVVRATSGNNQLGGAHFDRVLRRLIFDRMRQDDIEEPVISASETIKLADHKERLEEYGRVDITGFEAHPDFETTITIEEFEEAAAQESDAVKACLRDVLSQNPEIPIGNIVFVGGSSRLKLIRRISEECVREAGHADVRSDYGVSEVDKDVGYGAALYCHSDSSIGGSRIAHEMPAVADVAARAIGVAVTVGDDHDVFDRVLKRFHKFGTWSEAPRGYHNVFEGNSILFKVYEGNSDTVTKNDYVDEFVIEGPREYGKGEMKVDVDMFLSINGTIEIKATPTGDLAKDRGTDGCALRFQVNRRDDEQLMIRSEDLVSQMSDLDSDIETMSKINAIRREIRKTTSKADKAGCVLPEAPSTESRVVKVWEDYLGECVEALASMADKKKSGAKRKRPEEACESVGNTSKRQLPSRKCRV